MINTDEAINKQTLLNMNYNGKEISGMIQNTAQKHHAMRKHNKNKHQKRREDKRNRPDLNENKESNIMKRGRCNVFGDWEICVNSDDIYLWPNPLKSIRLCTHACNTESLMDS